MVNCEKTANKFIPPGWWTQNPGPAVRAYTESLGRSDLRRLRSDYPYGGVKWTDGFVWFRQRMWRPRSSYNRCLNLNADLIGAAEYLTRAVEYPEAVVVPASPSRSSWSARIPMLDGGVKLINPKGTGTRPEIQVEGPLVLRALLEFLRFDGPVSRLTCERKAPTRDEVWDALGSLRSEWLWTPNGELAEEVCPICGRANSPGAVDSCGHIYGSMWDGDLIWNDSFEQEIGESWGEITDSLWELRKGGETTRIEKAKRLAEELSVPPCWYKLATDGEGAISAICKFIDFQSGPTIVTDGMLSGEGYSLYLEDPTEVLKLGKALARIARALNRIKPRSTFPSPFSLVSKLRSLTPTLFVVASLALLVSSGFRVLGAFAWVIQNVVDLPFISLLISVLVACCPGFGLYAAYVSLASSKLGPTASAVVLLPSILGDVVVVLALLGVLLDFIKRD